MTSMCLDIPCIVPSLNNNNVWTVVDLLLGKKAVASKWVFRLKKNPDEFIECFKARVVAKGYM